MFNFKSIFSSNSKSVSPVEAAATSARAQCVKDNFEAEQAKVLAEQKLQQARIKHAERKAQDDYQAELLKSAKDTAKEMAQLIGDVKAMKLNTQKNKEALASETIKIQSLFDEMDNL